MKIIILLALCFCSCKSSKIYFSEKIEGKVDSVHSYSNYFKVFIKGEKYILKGNSLSPVYDFRIVKGDYLSKPAGTDTLHIRHEEDEGFIFILK